MGAEGGLLCKYENGLIKVKVRLPEEELTGADTNLLTASQRAATRLDPIPLMGPAQA